MTNNPTNPNFDWVSARVQCSLESEFEQLKKLILSNYTARVASLSNDEAFDFSFEEEESRLEFSVSRKPKIGMRGRVYKAVFARRKQSDGGEFISIFNECSLPGKPETIEKRNHGFLVSVVLNDDGVCRFRVQGDCKEYMRWQVARRALHPLFFESVQNLLDDISP